MEVYADNAATTRMKKSTLDAMLPYMTETFGNPSSLHSAGQRAARAVTLARETMAMQLGCHPREIIFTSGGSEANQQAILSAAVLGADRGKKHIVTTAFEHPSVLRLLDRLALQGYEMTRLQVPPDGVIAPSQVQAAIRPDTCLVTVMYANNEIGTIQPVSEIGALCRKAGVLFHTDAVQAAGHVPIDVKRQKIGLLSLSAHKFHGPKGIGVLYAAGGIPVTRLIEGGGQERDRRGGTENVPAIAGMAAAFAEACLHMEETAGRVARLRDTLQAGLARIPNTVVNGAAGQRLPGHLNLSFAGVEGDVLLLMLDQKGIFASSGSACAAGSLAPSHVLLALGRTEEQARSSLRLSLSDQNTPEEVEYLLTQITASVAALRRKVPAGGDRPARSSYAPNKERMVL